jgi:23S rRNA (cytidine1920-2'-O)/16S rRNA (cytidine1409-2'-O)-methyltransferase
VASPTTAWLRGCWPRQWCCTGVKLRGVARERLDAALVRRGLAETRERAHALILSGAVTVDGLAATRPAQPVAAEAAIEVAQSDEYVSRGALKLQKALDYWGIDPAGRVVLDVGASTGGFTDLLLRRGARKVYAVDVGHGQLHYRLRNDPRVVAMERTNVRNLTQLPEAVQLGVVDVSFISLKLALPPMFKLVQQEILALIKPQFEAGRAFVGKGGVVRDPKVREHVLQELQAWSRAQPWRLVDTVESPIKGPAGNVEFLSRWQPIMAESAEPADHQELRDHRSSGG